MDRVSKIKNGESEKFVIVFSDEIGWHTSQIERRLNSLGVKTQILSLSTCSISIDCSKEELLYRNFHGHPNCCFIRGIEGGSLEEVTRRLAVLHQLKVLGVTVINSAKGIENSVDKYMTSFLLRVHDIPTPDSWVLEGATYSLNFINNLIDKEHYLVIKPLFMSRKYSRIQKRLLMQRSYPDY